ncbi:hypothetical protein EVAR_52651_1 [Eumeta japonica]|uniref:Uncharacterized protein n=1 Tax=Eumeta variegata TaxID=151549 RepID=A0A4C1XZ35_EUMVA|nr:hypothetical protein EVAR_52651_1 [Eumeta japonica]
MSCPNSNAYGSTVALYIRVGSFAAVPPRRELRRRNRRRLAFATKLVCGRRRRLSHKYYPGEKSCRCVAGFFGGNRTSNGGEDRPMKGRGRTGPPISHSIDEMPTAEAVSVFFYAAVNSDVWVRLARFWSPAQTRAETVERRRLDRSVMD